ncbi:MAG: ATP-dependent metallopeptidase FtsH/Yme1/Tma family protein [Deltaproteobacteria bacterium]|nr:ATP-dependent metallopeptidase FtsH/Yme1/Tma family protein [Deltaproteobacteria bacterium]TLN04730.1 MAG: ATP-dependent zinc metalloprotease FtsH [bacterium]
MAQSMWKPLLALVAFVVVINVVYPMVSQKGQLDKAEVPYSQFKNELARDNVKEITMKGSLLNGVFKTKVQAAQVAGKETPSKATTNFFTILPGIDDPALMAELQAKKVMVKAISTESSPFTTALLYLIPWVLIIGVWVFFARSMKGQGPGNMMGGFAKSGAKLHDSQKTTVTFADVAGMEEAKQELHEVVEYLKEPKKFERIGGKVPRGILLVGPPGTGKTLLARAVAGEAGVAFFSISASQFIEMFVGVGASRVRDLFAVARKEAPSIIFIDELDAVGRSRGAGFGGGHDEREQTLNQLLSEMDGFESHEEIIVLSATNRPDVLDPALLRPGRFDRRVVIERPDWRDRESILKVHTRKTPLSADVNLAVIAKGTPGMTGADLESLVNEAAILAARENSETVTMNHLELAKDKVLMGGERKLYLSDQEKRITAIHESGHVLVAKLLPGTDPVHKVTIIPRGMALGVTQQLPEDDRHHYPKSYLVNRLSVVLGGRVAERLVFNDVSTGAQSDLKIVTELAEKMVCQWGMSDKIGPVTFSRGEEHPFLGMKLAQEKSFSEEMAWQIDQEITVVIKDAEDRAMEILSSNRNQLEALATALLEEETLDSARIDSILASV